MGGKECLAEVLGMVPDVEVTEGRSPKWVKDGGGVWKLEGQVEVGRGKRRSRSWRVTGRHRGMDKEWWDAGLTSDRGGESVSVEIRSWSGRGTSEVTDPFPHSAVPSFTGESQITCGSFLHSSHEAKILLI